VIAPSATETSILLLADISGYTRFLEAVQEAHPEMGRSGGSVAPAYQVLSGLLDTVMARIAPSFSLLQVEGDALFARAPESQVMGVAADIIVMVRSAYEAFRQQIQYSMDHYRHDCQACVILPSLELKFVVHRGIVVSQRIAGREQLAGPAVNLAHRLLKNSITERTRLRAYLFVTDAAADALGLTSAFGMRHTENYPDVGRVSGILIALETAPATESSTSSGIRA
jgi:uncharacterized protein DUF2652